MSRVGNRPIKIIEGVNIEKNSDSVILKSAKGEIKVNIPDVINLKEVDGSLVVSRSSNDRFARSQHGLTARLLKNGIEGLSTGIKKVLEFKGTGYRAKIEENKIVLNMGYSHEVVIAIPAGVEASVVKNTIIVTGYDAAVVGNFAAEIREVRPPEVYKGKGIKYSTEVIKRKDGKVASGGKG